MFNEREYRAALARAGYTQKQLAKEIGVSEATLSRKVKSGVFLTNEVYSIVRVLNLDNPGPIFFGEE